MQPEFVYEVLKGCRKRDINTAIETCANGSWEWLEKILGVTDTVYMDLKAVVDETHRAITGVSNSLILENIQKTDIFMGMPAGAGKTFIIRMPMIPGMNDSVQDAQEAAHFLDGLRNCAWVEILPFHNFGEGKYTKLDKKYEFAGLPNSTEETVAHLRDVIATCGHEVRIGKI